MVPPTSKFSSSAGAMWGYGTLPDAVPHEGCTTLWAHSGQPPQRRPRKNKAETFCSHETLCLHDHSPESVLLHLTTGYVGSTFFPAACLASLNRSCENGVRAGSISGTFFAAGTLQLGCCSCCPGEETPRATHSRLSSFDTPVRDAE